MLRFYNLENEVISNLICNPTLLARGVEYADNTFAEG